MYSFGKITIKASITKEIKLGKYGHGYNNNTTVKINRNS